ncbi:hypothetical protein GCM10010149_88550 [Nonomuraea roseoviolacea subsp. roseoviolacea]|uniref:hypothetical protein n=1 Tax=Nonomuraea roseoviolacea TaxID=103837 RepID=UPI0031DCA672
MTHERKIIELFDDGQNIHDWSWWKRNYILNMYGVRKGELPQDWADSYSKNVYYLREPDSAVLTQALSVRDMPATEIKDGQPGDTRHVSFIGYLSRAGEDRFPSFDYSPVGGYEVPPAHLVWLPVTLDMLKEYTRYYIDGGGWEALRDADFGGYHLHDKRQPNYPPELKDAWAITRPMSGLDGSVLVNREVLMVDGTWVPMKSKKIKFSFVNEYPKFTFKLKQAIKLIEGFVS